MNRRVITGLALFVLFVVLGVGQAKTAEACGGLFCQNSPVDQNAERIIFTQNRDGTVSAIIQIQYTGFSEDFSWILPLPTPITAEDIEVPETGMSAFLELEQATNPVFIPPPTPDCARQDDGFGFALGAVPPALQEGSVEVFASGEVGPFGFDVIGSEDPNALIIWLRDHSYMVTEQMEPLINVYVEEQMVFLAMRLLPEQGVQDIQPVKVTYATERPMIPLRLTAVAANPDMAVIVWFYGEKQAIPVNYAHMEVADEELTFFTFGGNNYRTLMGQRADEYGGQAFITEYAAPSHELAVSDPLLQQLGRDYPYLTRLNTVLSPEEMTVDPVFDYDPQLRDVSNVHDLSDKTGLYDCERAGGSPTTVNLPAFGEVTFGGSQNTNEPVNGNTFLTGFFLGGFLVFLGLLVIGFSAFLIIRARR
ncbi:MAG: DUF2330 domain-containing protein [Candidatus Promineifilaceae bacterium]